MSDSSSDRSDRADRPAGVTDPLLWRLATAVAKAHEADDEGLCGSPSCAGASWPCDAWHSAQQGLLAAQAGRGTESETPGIDDDAGETGNADHGHPLTGWSTDLLPAGPTSLQLTPLPAQREAATPAAVSAA